MYSLNNVILSLVLVTFMWNCSFSNADEGPEKTPPAGRCPYTVSTTQYYLTTVTTLVRITTYKPCFSWDFKCTVYKYVTQTALRTASRIVEQTLYRPCPACPHDNCTNLCNACNVDNTLRCDRDTGICVCHPGWNGTTCNHMCDAGYFGENCVNSCVCNSNTSISCDRYNGSCTCLSGWSGPRCTNEIPETPKSPPITLTILMTPTPIITNPPPSPIPAKVGNGHSESQLDPGMLAGVVIITAVVIATIIAVSALVVLYKRRRFKQKQSKCDVANNTLEMATREHVYEDPDGTGQFPVPSSNVHVYSDIINQASSPQASERSFKVIAELKNKLSRENVYVDVDLNEQNTETDDSDGGKIDTPLAGSDDEVYKIPRLQNGSPIAMPTEESYMDMGNTQPEYDVPKQHGVAMETETPYSKMDDMYQTPGTGNNVFHNDNEEEHIYHVPQSVVMETDATYMPMGNGYSEPNTDTAAMTTDSAYTDMRHNSPVKSQKPNTVYTHLYQIPKPQPQYADIGDAIANPQKNVYNKVDRSKKSYHDKDDTSHRYDDISDHGKTPPITDNTYDAVSHQSGMPCHHGNTMNQSSEYAHLESDSSEDGTYDALDHGSLQFKHRHGYKQGIYDHLQQIDDDEEEDDVDPESVPLK